MPSDIDKIYGLVGFPLGHSFSKDFFNRKFQAEGIRAEYRNFEIPEISQFPTLVVANPALAGLNVTIPYKQQVMQYLDAVDDTAAKIGAVNVVKFCQDGKLKGYNSDIIGFVDSMRPLLQPWHKHALVLGTGGASKAVVAGLLSLGISPKYVSRTPSADAIGYDQIDADLLEKYTVIVNTTPVGMYPKVDACPDIPYSLLTPRHLCYDLVYNPIETKFMAESAHRGAQVKNGLEMLKLQALAAWEIWNSKE